MDPKATIEGACNIGDEQTCPHCNGWKEPDEDICQDCAEDFGSPDEELDGED